jgi:hypothetical protein
MADPATILIGVTLAGAAMSAVGAVGQANAAASAGKYNAQMKQNQAVASMDQANADAQRVQREGTRAAGSLLAGYGASGVATDEGSPLDVLRDSWTQNALDVSNIMYRGRLKATGYYNDATLDRHSAEVASEQGPLNASAYLLTGAGRAGSNYYASKRPLTQTAGGGYATNTLD